MEVKFYGTRGSIPISNPESVMFGGNTTCIRVRSEYLPKHVALVIDSGSGFVPMSYELLQEKVITEVWVLYTHYHHDHTQGIFLSPLLFMKHIKLVLCGPVDASVNPKRMMEDMMRPPYFPVHLKEVGSHLVYKDFEFPTTLVLIFHPAAGVKLMNLDDYERLMAAGKAIPFEKEKREANECLAITMHKSQHPEQTISYRIEEKAEGKSFVLLTDHQNEDGWPMSLQRHLKGVDLLVMDSQYTREQYDGMCAGFGHGTPDYCIKTALKVGAKRLGLTHHNPTSSDANIENICQMAKNLSDGKVMVFACTDYQKIII